MAGELPIIQDISLYHENFFLDHLEDDIDFPDADIPTDVDPPMTPSDVFGFEDSEPLIDQFFSNETFDLPENISTSPQPDITASVSPSIDIKLKSNISLPFINPPEPFYHVRYLSEITSSSLDGNVINTRIKTKKNTSGRYLKGIRGRYVTITLPLILSDFSNLFIRVTRLTVPYQDISFIHPYPLLYSSPKKKMHLHVINYRSSICYKINKDEIYSCSKYFPNLTLTRLKQCQLNKIDSLYSFDNSDRCYPFLGNNAKEKIAIYQLKKSQLDFRLVFLREETGEFCDIGAFCRSDELIEAEGCRMESIVK